MKENNKKGSILSIKELTASIVQEEMKVEEVSIRWSEEETNNLLQTVTNIKEKQQKKVNNPLIVNMPLTIKVVWTAVALLLQKGAGFKKARGADSVIVDGVKFSTGELREARKRNAIKQTLRQLARTYADEIVVIAQKHNVVGNLAPSILKRTPELNKEEFIYWMSDFQLLNRKCPQRIRQAITEQLIKATPK